MKIREFQNWMGEKEVDMALFLNNDYFKKDPNLFYFVQARIDWGCLIIPREGTPVLFIPGFEYERIKRVVKIPVKKPEKNLFQTIKKLFPAEKIGVNKNYFSLNENEKLKKVYKKEKLEDTSQICAELRFEKTEKEIAKIRKACRITDRIFESLLDNIKKLKTEKKVSEYIKKRILEEECQPAFEPIVASGRHATHPHHEPVNKMLKGFCIIDFGVRYKGYCSDMTRTLCKGNTEKAYYEKVLDLQENAVQMVKKGIVFEKIESLVRKKLGENEKYFVHKLGHSVGIEVHDAIPFPKRAHIRKVELKNNSVITIEPGIYIPNKLGIRIEDTVLVKEKAVCLTKSPKELISF